MKTVKELSKITGISIRTLRYYDEINLLKPTKLSKAGYRLYDQTALSRLQEILFFKELDLPLSTIKSMLDNPSYERQQILQMQKSLLERKRNRLNGIIELINDAMEGVNTMNFEPFNEEDITKIINHSLELQSEETKKTIIEKYGSLETFHEFVSGNCDILPPLKPIALKWGLPTQWPYEPSINRLSPCVPRFFFCPETDMFYFQRSYAHNTLLASSRILTAAFTSLSIRFPHSHS